MDNFITELELRGMLYQATNKNELSKLMYQPTVVYIGFDCTADSLHVGSLLQIMIIRLLLKYGHQPIILLGGATSRIGDPSFKTSARKLLAQDTVEINKVGILEVFRQFGLLDKVKIVDNSEWLSELGYIDFLQSYGALFSISRLLSFDSIKTRLDRQNSLSFLEFNYVLLQAYDFVHLHQKYNCRVQIGGSDQWGNIVSGVELNRRINSNNEIFGLTTPLVTNSNGSKMGKTVNGAIWLSEHKLSSYDYWQFWRNVNDNDVEKFLKIFTDLPLDTISTLLGTNSDINDVKKILADEATKICHGKQKALEASELAKQIFEKKDLNVDNYPKVAINGDNLLLVSVMKDTGLTQSIGEARRLIRGGGVYVNNIRVPDIDYVLGKNDFQGQSCKISVGKKRHVMLVLG